MCLRRTNHEAPRVTPSPPRMQEIAGGPRRAAAPRYWWVRVEAQSDPFFGRLDLRIAPRATIPQSGDRFWLGPIPIRPAAINVSYLARGIADDDAVLELVAMVSRLRFLALAAWTLWRRSCR